MCDLIFNLKHKNTIFIITNCNTQCEDYITFIQLKCVIYFTEVK